MSSISGGDTVELVTLINLHSGIRAFPCDHLIIEIEGWGVAATAFGLSSLIIGMWMIALISDIIWRNSIGNMRDR